MPILRTAPRSSARPTGGQTFPRILFVSGPASGGLRQHLRTLLTSTGELGVSAAVAGPDHGYPPEIEWFPLEVGDRPRLPRDLRALGQLRRAAGAWQPDLIHAHGVKAALLTFLAFPPAAPPLVATYHNRWLGGPLTALLRALAGRATASITVSDAVQASLAAHGIRPSGLRVIRNGIDVRAFYPAPAPQHVDPFTFLFLGRLTDEKGVPLLLELARQLEGQVGLRIVAAGEGPLQSAVEAVAGRPGGVLEFLGSQRAVLPLYHRADAVLLPSLSEGLPMVALEAMACGLPLIASAVGGVPELVVDGETGILLTSRDPAVWTRTLQDLAQDRRKAQRLGSAGRRRVESDFTERQMLEALNEVYRSALQR